MGSTGCVPTISFPVPSIQLPFGIEMQATADFSKGPPSQCAMLSSLMLQMQPAMAPMIPIINILGVFSALKDFVDGLNPLKLPPLLEALAKVIAMLDPLPFVETVKTVLLLLISYLECFIQTMEGLLAFQASIDLSIAAGNPNLTISLQCASDNAQTSMQQMMQALGPIGPIMDLIQPIISVANLPITLPSLTSLQGAQDMETALKSLSKILSDLQQVIQSIP